MSISTSNLSKDLLRGREPREAGGESKFTSVNSHCSRRSTLTCVSVMKPFAAASGSVMARRWWPALNRPAIYLWEQRTRRVPLSKATELIDGKRLDEFTWESSKTRACGTHAILSSPRTADLNVSLVTVPGAGCANATDEMINRQAKPHSNLIRFEVFSRELIFSRRVLPHSK